MSDKALIKLEGDVYHVDKTKMEQVLAYLVNQPFNQVGAILKGLVVFNDAPATSAQKQQGATDAKQEEKASA